MIPCSPGYAHYAKQYQEETIYQCEIYPFIVQLILSSYCKSQLCSLFHERTCSRFTRLFVCRRLSPCPKYLINPYNAIFLKSQGSKDIKNDILDCQIHKYTNTNSQIHKYTNTAYDKMTEIPNICYIFEQLVVQGCQK